MFIKRIEESTRAALSHLRFLVESNLVDKLKSTESLECTGEIKLFPMDSVIINLKSDLSWNMNEDPPVLPNFFFI